MASAAAKGEGEEEEDVVVVEGDTERKKAVEMDAAMRRELAIRRLREEAEAEANEAGTRKGRSRRDFAVFENARGDALFTQSWTPAAADRLKYSHLPTPLTRDFFSPRIIQVRAVLGRDEIERLGIQT
jgi:acylglycerol lipase